MEDGAAVDSSFVYLGVALIFLFVLSFLVKGRPSLDERSESAKAKSDGDASAPKQEQEVNAISNPPTANKVNVDDDSVKPKSETPQQPRSNNNWQCACEGGGIFLPQSLMKSIGGPAAALRMGRGECYHKQM